MDFTSERINTQEEFTGRDLIIGHVLCKDEAETLKNLLVEKLPDITVTFADMGPLVGAHTGPGTLAVAFYSKQ